MGVIMRKIRVSSKFVAAVKLSPRPAYRIAQAAGLNPVILSKLIHGIVEVRPGDPRVLAVARVLGLSEADSFEEDF